MIYRYTVVYVTSPPSVLRFGCIPPILRHLGLFFAWPTLRSPLFSEPLSKGFIPSGRECCLAAPTRKQSRQAAASQVNKEACAPSLRTCYSSGGNIEERNLVAPRSLSLSLSLSLSRGCAGEWSSLGEDGGGMFGSSMQSTLTPGQSTDGFHVLIVGLPQGRDKKECPKEQTHQLGSQLSNISK